VNRLFWIVVGLPIAVIIVVLAVINRHPVTLNLDPFSPADPAISTTIPLFVMLFATFAVGLAIGGLVTWSTQRKWRRLAKRQKSESGALRTQLERLQNAKSGAVGSALPAPDSKAA
jgi:uncharacterized integral membrane protein